MGKDRVQSLVALAVILLGLWLAWMNRAEATQSIVMWQPATTDANGAPLPNSPAGAELEVRVRTVMADGTVSAWTPPVSKLVCEANYALYPDETGGQSCQFIGCHP
jgi:hypothetical protein